MQCASLTSPCESMNMYCTYRTSYCGGAQTQIATAGCVQLYRDSDPSGATNCDDACSNNYISSKWVQCCSSGSNCNNLVIPSTVKSVSDMEKCYLGASASECKGTLRPPPDSTLSLCCCCVCCRRFCPISSAAS